MMLISKVVSLTRFFNPVELRSVFENPACMQCVRWRRKPWALGTAKSKIFRVPKAERLPPDEMLEMRRLVTHYNTAMKSIRKFLEDEVASAASSENTNEPGPSLVETTTDFVKCKEINDQWNAEVSIIRENRLAKEREKRFTLIMAKVEESALKEKERAAAIDEIVRQEKEQEKYYITPSNIDEAIETALQKEADFNFAIDTGGKVYIGYSLEPSMEEDQMKSNQTSAGYSMEPSMEEDQMKSNQTSA